MPSRSIDDLCKEQNLTADQLAEKATVDPLRVAAIVQGRWTPSPDDRKKIAAALSVEVDQISWGHKTPIQHIYGQGPS